MPITLLERFEAHRLNLERLVVRARAISNDLCVEELEA